MSVALSTAIEPIQSAAWLVGFLGSSGLLLIHDDALWSLVDSWVCSLSDEIFMSLLPLVRRTISRFSSTERRQLAEHVHSNLPFHLSKDRVNRETDDESVEEDSLEINLERAKLVLPILNRLFNPQDPQVKVHTP